MRRIFLLCILLLVHVVLLFNFKFTAWPEMLAYPYLLQKGYRLYEDFVLPYLPLLPLTILFFSKWLELSVNLIFGFTVTIFIILDLSIWYLANKWFSLKIAFGLTALYIILSLMFDGNGLWFDLFVTPILFLAFMVFHQFIVSQKLFLSLFSGILLGICFLVKQTALAFIFLEIIYLIRIKKLRLVHLFILLTSLPFLVLLIFYPLKDLFEWGIWFPLFAVSRMPGYLLLPTFKQILILCILIIPVAFVTIQRDFKFTMLTVWFGLSLLFLFPRFDYFHLQPAMPYMVLIIGLAINKFKNRRGFYLVYGLFIILFGVYTTKYVLTNWRQPTRFFSAEELQMSHELLLSLANNEPIYFYNTPANYFVSANLIPSKPWVDLFPWYLEFPGMQERVIQSLEEVRFVVSKPFLKGGQFELGAYVPIKIDNYVRSNYHQINFIGKDIMIWERN